MLDIWAIFGVFGGSFFARFWARQIPQISPKYRAFRSGLLAPKKAPKYRPNIEHLGLGHFQNVWCVPTFAGSVPTILPRFSEDAPPPPRGAGRTGGGRALRRRPCPAESGASSSVPLRDFQVNPSLKMPTRSGSPDFLFCSTLYYNFPREATG